MAIYVNFNRNSSADILTAQYVNPVSQIYLTNTTYQNCNTITSINLHNLPFVNNEMRNAFYGCSNLTSVTGLSNTITSLNYSFALCYNLSNITIPNSVVDLSRTFTHCDSITGNIIIPNSVKSMDGTFYDTELESTPIIPDSVVSMSSTFSLCSNLVTVRKFSNNVINMSSTFSYCNRLVNTPTIPNSVIDLSSTFRFCSSITNVSSAIPKSVATLLNTFYDCTNLTGNIYVAGTTVVNAQNCFQNTSLPKNVYIPFKTQTQQNLYGFQRGFSMSSIGNTPQLLYTDTLTLSNTINLYDANGDKVNYTINTYRDNPISGKIFYVYEDNVTYYKYNSAYDLVPGSNTPTYNAFIEAGYDTAGTKDGVYLKDINEQTTTYYGWKLYRLGPSGSPAPFQGNHYCYSTTEEPSVGDLVYTGTSETAEITGYSTGDLQFMQYAEVAHYARYSDYDTTDLSTAIFYEDPGPVVDAGDITVG